MLLEELHFVIPGIFFRSRTLHGEIVSMGQNMIWIFASDDGPPTLKGFSIVHHVRFGENTCH